MSTAAFSETERPSPWAGKRLLFIGQYPLTTLNSAPQVRISSLAQALDPLCKLTFITGSRESRRTSLWWLLLSGGWADFDGVYIESASSTAMEADLLLLRRWFHEGIPVSIYIRDAYPLFTDYFDAKPFKHKLLRRAWLMTMKAYRRWATILYFPTKRLSAFITAPDKRLLPPAGTARPPATAPRSGVIYVGEVEPVSGMPTLLEAGAILAEERPDFHLTIVCRTPEVLQAWRDRPWLSIVEASGEALSDYLLTAQVAVVPRPRNDYNDLCLPVKLLEYMAHGLPVVVTDCPETADFIRQTKAGEVVPGSATGLAAGIRRLLDHAEHREAKAQAALTAIAGPHSWDRRAETILRDLFPGADPRPQA